MELTFQGAKEFCYLNTGNKIKISGNGGDKPGQFLTDSVGKFYHVTNIKNLKEAIVGTAIEYQKLMTEIVYINIPGPAEPTPGMSGGELLHGFLAELYKAPSAETRNFVNSLCLKWNVHYREARG
jgi:hypothetical protein